MLVFAHMMFHIRLHMQRKASQIAILEGITTEGSPGAYLGYFEQD